MITNYASTALKYALKFAFVASLLCQPLLADTGAVPPAEKSEPILPIPLPHDLNQDKLKLGSMLFNDTRLSRDGQLSCASCHHLDTGGDDNIAISAYINTPPAVNTPSIFNVKYNFRQNWDGSATSLPMQLNMAIRRFGGKTAAWDGLLSRLNKDQKLVRQFAAIYQTSTINRENFSDALVYYVEALNTPNARFDQYLRGDAEAISSDELRGYALFKEYGCVSCHQGVNVGGNLYQRFGIFYDYFRARGNIVEGDYGRMNITGNSADAHVFKVPSLRNVALTAPYLHDGQIDTLEQVVAIMGLTQLGLEINKNEIALIVKFLNTLTGDTTNIVKAEMQ